MRVHGKLWVRVFIFALFGIGLATVSAVAQGNLPESGTITGAGPTAWDDCDLLIKSVSGPATGKTGDFIRVAVKVKNDGIGIPDDFRVGIYLSEDKRIDPESDRLIGGIVYKSLIPYQTSESILILMVPESTPAGNYFLGAMADYTQKVGEDSESNNTRASGASIRITVGQ